MYSRVFDPAVTKEIRLFGLNDEDVFEIEENVSSPIRIRIIGGRGNDTFNIKGNVRNIIYDLNSDLNFIKNSNRTRNRFSDDPPANERSILGFSYNTLQFPQLMMGYNYDDGFMVGTGISRRTYGFLNLPYATDQQFSAIYAVERKALQLRYRGEFNQIGRKTDLLIRQASIRLISPTLQDLVTIQMCRMERILTFTGFAIVQWRQSCCFAEDLLKACT